MGEKSKTGNAWVNFILIFVMGAIFAIGFFKVPPAMGSLMEYFQCGLGEAGWFMSACSVAGTVIAFATGAIQTKIGPKGMLIAALVCMALDSLVGVLAPNVEVFIASRFIGPRPAPRSSRSCSRIPPSAACRTPFGPAGRRPDRSSC